MVGGVAPDRGVRLLRRFGLVLVGLVGLVFLVVGGVLLLSQGWDRTTGQVGPCVGRIERSGTGTRTIRTCDVTWTRDGVSRTSQVSFGGGSVHSGDTVQLRVHGTTVTEASPLWVGVTTAAVGLVLVAPAAVRLRRR